MDPRSDQPQYPPQPGQNHGPVPYTPSPQIYSEQYPDSARQPQQPGDQPQINSPAQQQFQPDNPHMQDYSVDYLNSIAPKQPVKKVKPLLLFAMIGGVIGLAVIAMLLLMPRTPDMSAQTNVMYARIETLQAATNEQKKRLRETDVVELNATFDSTLTTMTTDLAGVMSAKGMKVIKNKPSPEEKTYRTALLKKMSDSYQRGTLDRTYGPQMTYEIIALRTKLSKLKATSKSKSVNEFCDKSTANLNTILESLRGFISTKSN